MTGVPRSVTEHRLNVREGCPPVRQKKRGQAPERTKAIQAEVEKLVEAGIMREVYYHDWLSNPVMVKKHDGSWRMCVDFKDLDKACLQDCYPLPEIDWKVESLCGYPFKCFLDAYKGYHQIQMAAADEEKTAFHTGHGVYCYTKMPFGLKNAGATYQRRMDKAFENQMGRNIEVYVDDLVVKSHTEAEMTLKKCIKKRDFRWTKKAEQAFQQLKQHLSALPLLAAPKPQEELIMYLSATHGAISAVLMTERGTYELIEGILYKRSFLTPWLRCVGPLQGEYIIKEIHEGSCSMHAGPRSVVAKAIRLGYFWPTMHKDAQDMIRKCSDCQIHRPVTRHPQQPLTPITAQWPFYKWGIDIAGPFPEGPGKVKFLIFVMDYFTKWIEAKAVATITGGQ
nr:reverse transcriptase domain-containing protein [Tanacetum cinerariifolium]